jgi:hypothetical protein
VFEYVQGGEVFLHLRNKGKFEPTHAMFYIAEVGDEMEHRAST